MNNNTTSKDEYIGGVPVSFPYSSPYTAQRQVMAKVITALNRKQNALLEVKYHHQ